MVTEFTEFEHKDTSPEIESAGTIVQPFTSICSVKFLIFNFIFQK